MIRSPGTVLRRSRSIDPDAFRRAPSSLRVSALRSATYLIVGSVMAFAAGGCGDGQLEDTGGGGSKISKVEVHTSQWLREDAHPVGAQAGVTQPGKSPRALTRPALRKLSQGPMSRDLSQIVTPLMPHGAKLTSALDYPTVRAATVSYVLPNGEVLTIARQRLERALLLSSITVGATSKSVRHLATQSVLVTTKHAGSAVQAVLVRPSGIAVTVTWLPGNLSASEDESVATARVEALATRLDSDRTDQ